MARGITRRNPEIKQKRVCVCLCSVCSISNEKCTNSFLFLELKESLLHVCQPIFDNKSLSFINAENVNTQI